MQMLLRTRAWWIETDRKKALKIIKLIREVQRNPFEGTGQPEALKHLELCSLSSRSPHAT